jgi:hypothetical protein
MGPLSGWDGSDGYGPETMGTEAGCTRRKADKESSGHCGVGKDRTPLKAEAVQFDSEMAAPAELS